MPKSMLVPAVRLASIAVAINLSLAAMAYAQEPALMSDGWSAAHPADEPGRSRHIADFIAGMTDRFAIDQYAKIFGKVPEGLSNV